MISGLFSTSCLLISSASHKQLRRILHGICSSVHRENSSSEVGSRVVMPQRTNNCEPKVYFYRSFLCQLPLLSQGQTNVVCQYEQEHIRIWRHGFTGGETGDLPYQNFAPSIKTLPHKTFQTTIKNIITLCMKVPWFYYSNRRQLFCNCPLFVIALVPDLFLAENQLILFESCSHFVVPTLFSLCCCLKLGNG